MQLSRRWNFYSHKLQSFQIEEPPFTLNCKMAPGRPRFSTSLSYDVFEVTLNQSPILSQQSCSGEIFREKIKNAALEGWGDGWVMKEIITFLTKLVSLFHNSILIGFS